MSAELVALMLMMLALGASLLPLLGQETPAPASETAGLSAEKDALVRALRDLDMDLALGRLTEEEHAAARDALETRAVSVMAQLDVAPVDPSAETRG